jgi:hypothetical protein
MAEGNKEDLMHLPDGTVYSPFILRDSGVAYPESEGHKYRLVHDEAQADAPAESAPSEDAADSSPRGTE